MGKPLGKAIMTFILTNIDSVISIPLWFWLNYHGKRIVNLGCECIFFSILLSFTGRHTDRHISTPHTSCTFWITFKVTRHISVFCKISKKYSHVWYKSVNMDHLTETKDNPYQESLKSMSGFLTYAVNYAIHFAHMLVSCVPIYCLYIGWCMYLYLVLL